MATRDIAELGIVVDATQAASATKTLDGLSQQAKTTAGSVQFLTDTAKALTAAFAALKLAQLIQDSALLNARFETMGVVIGVAGNNAGYTRAQMDDLETQLEKTGISAIKSRENLSSLASANIDLSKAAQIARAAQDLAVVGNINSSDAFARLVQGIKSGEVEVLRTIGLNVNFENGYKKLALQLGTTTDKLTDQQKQQSRLNTTLTAAAGYSGIYEQAMGTAGKQLNSLSRYAEDAKVKLGEVFNETLTAVVGKLTEALKAANAELDKSKATGGTADAGHLLSEGFQTAFQAVTVFGANVLFVFKTMGREIGGFGAILGQIFMAPLNAVNNLGAALDKALTGDFKGAAATAAQSLQDLKNGIKNVVDISDDMDKAAAADRAALDAFGDSILATTAATKGQTQAQKDQADQAEKDRIAKGIADRDAAAAEAKRLAAQEEAMKQQKKYDQMYKDDVKQIQEKTAASALDLATEGKLTEGQQFAVKILEDLRDGTIKLSAAQKIKLAGLLEEMLAQEALNKAEQATTSYLQDSTRARVASAAGLQMEYALYGKIADERDVAAVGLKAEADMQAYLDDQKTKGIKLSDEQIQQIKDETSARAGLEAQALAESKALGYAQQLHDLNLQFNVDIILDDQKRAAAQLALDASTWQKRIALAGDGTEAQKKLQEEYDEWYKDQSAKPQLEVNRQLWASIDSLAHDTFISIFDHGTDTFTKLRDSLKSTLLDLLYQMTLKKWIINIGTSLTSSVADAAAASSSSGGASILSSLSSGTTLYSAGKTIYNGFASGVSASLGSVVSGLGNTFGSSALSSFGSGLGLTSAQAGEAAAQYTAAAAAAQAAGDGVAAGTYTAAAGGLSAGASAASVIPIVGWIIAGMSAAAGFRAQGFDPNNGTTNDLGKVVGAVPLSINAVLQKLGVGSALANILTGASLNTRLFGRANPVVTSQGIRGTATTEGVVGEDYANITEKGGLFRSDNNYTKSAVLDSATDTSFDDTVKGIAASLKSFANVLGQDGSALNGFSESFDIKLTSDATANQTAITAWFAQLSDDMANKLIPNLAAFAQTGETASATLQRLSTDYSGVQATLASIGVTMKQAFGVVGAAALTANEQLITAAGGLDTLGTLTDTFSQDFLSSAEQIKPVQDQLTAQLTALGYGSVTTAQQYHDAVLALASSGALATQSGADLYTQLLALAPAMKAVTDATQAASDAAAAAAQQQAATAAAAAATTQGLQDQIYDLTHTADQATQRQRDAELAGMTASDAELQKRIWALQDEAAATAAATSAAADYNDQLAASQQAAAAYQSSIGDLLVAGLQRAAQGAKDLQASLTALTTGALSPLSDLAKYQAAQAEFAAAKTSDPSGYAAAGNDFLSASKQLNGAGSFEYARDFAAVTKGLQDGIATDIANSSVASLSAFWASLTGNTISPSASVAAPKGVSTTDEAVLGAVQDMTGTVSTLLQKIATSSGTTADLTDRVTQGGNATRTEAT